MTILSFADTSAVSLAYALSDSSTAVEFGTVPTAMKLIPFTTESFKMSKESKTSSAISSGRRITGVKNTSGTVAGGATVEFGYNPFVKDMLQAAMMNTWSTNTLLDGAAKQYLAWEKITRTDTGATLNQDVEQYFGMLVDEATLTMNAGDICTLELAFVGANGEYISAVQGADGLGGSMASARDAFTAYELADASNNLDNVTIKDSTNAVIPLVFSQCSLKISNNAAAQTAVGHVFPAGMRTGQVGVEFSGTVFYSDQKALAAHMKNEILSVAFSIATKEGTYDFSIPAAIAQAPGGNAQGQNQDYTQTITLTGIEGTVGANKCVLSIAATDAP